MTDNTESLASTRSDVFFGGKTFDTHTHVVPRGLPFGSRSSQTARIVSRGDEHVVHIQGRPFRVVAPSAWDVEARLADMDELGVAAQLLSPMPDLFSYWDSPDAAEDYTRAVNESVANMVRVAPDRFRGLGILPMQDPARAYAQLAEVKSLGLAGVEVGGNIEGQPLHDKRFWEIFREAGRLDLMVFVHSYRPGNFSTLSRPGDANACTFPIDVGFALSALLAEGALGGSAGPRWLFSHGGGSAMLALPRLATLRAVASGREPVDEARGLADEMQRVFVDLLLYSAAALRFALATFGDRRLVVGSDYPFLPGVPGAILQELHELDDDTLQRVRWRNACELVYGTESLL